MEQKQLGWLNVEELADGLQGGSWAMFTRMRYPEPAAALRCASATERELEDVGDAAGEAQ